MDAALAAIKDTMDKNTGEGRDLDLARHLSTEYVEANPKKFAKLKLENMTRDECVAEVTHYCETSQEEKQWMVEAWLLHHFEPMTIIGGINWVGDINDLL
jgi:hypothetical protein